MGFALKLTPAGAAAAGTAAGGAPAPVGLAAGRLRRRGRRAVPALRAQIVGRASGTCSSTTSSGRCRSRACSARRMLFGELLGVALGVVGLEPRLALPHRPRCRRSRPTCPAASRCWPWPPSTCFVVAAPRPPAGGAGGPGARRAGAAPRAHDLRQGALAAVLHLDPAGLGAGRRTRPLDRHTRRPHARCSPRPSSRRSTGTC